MIIKKLFNKFVITTTFLFYTFPINAAWVDSPSGTVDYVRTYVVSGTGLRAQIGVTLATHDCGNGPSTYYFDSPNLTVDAVKSIISLATTAMIAGKNIVITYDCSIGGGYGFGTALTVSK